MICEQGGVEATLAVLVSGDRGNPLDRQVAAEALWLMIYDYESSVRLIKAGGHDQVIKLLRDEGSTDGKLAALSLRVLGETLYSEARSADIWGTADLDVIVQALDWALHSTSPSRSAFVVIACNVAALWVWRVRGPAVDAVAPLLGVVPRLLQVMAEDGPEDAELLQQACRLLHGLACKSKDWPDNVREPTLAALQQISSSYSFCPRPEINGFSVHALQAVEQVPPQSSLSAMD